MSGHVISQGILNLINPGFTNEKMEEPSELVFASFNQGTEQENLKKSKKKLVKNEMNQFHEFLCVVFLEYFP